MRVEKQICLLGDLVRKPTSLHKKFFGIAKLYIEVNNMCIEDLNKFCSIVREYNNAPVPYEELATKCAKEGLENVLVFLKNNHYIGIMKDGNTFFCWTKNVYYPESTIVNLKAELKGQTREPTLEERVAILEEQMKTLLAKEGK